MIERRAIPNLLTFARVLAVVAALWVAVWVPTQPVWLFAIFVAAAITDFFDGYLARRWNAITPLGTMLDPIADKLLVAVVLIYLLKFPLTPVLLVALLLLREFYIAGLREFLALRQAPLPVSLGGKWKTLLQMLGLAVLLATLSFPFGGTVIYRMRLQDALWNLGMVLLWVAALISVATAIDYTRKAWPHLRS